MFLRDPVRLSPACPCVMDMVNLKGVDNFLLIRARYGALLIVGPL